MKSIQKYEHERLLINEQGFTYAHWQAFVKLNTLHQGKYFDILHNGLKFKQYVGVIQVDDILIEIHPKADKNDTQAKWQNVLIPMLKACNRIKINTNGFAQVAKQNLNLLDLYFERYLNQIELLIQKGFIKKYRKQTTNTKALKGKLEFAQNLHRNLVHKERFYTTHQVYDTNHLLHQILYQAITVVKRYTHGTRLHTLTHRVAISFPEIYATSKINTHAFDSIRFDRKTAPYQEAFELAKLILRNHSPNIKVGQEKMFSLLFDMNQLWEEFIYIQLKRNTVLQQSQYSIHKQSSKKFWLSQRVAPDIIITNNQTKETYIIDTKWKIPINNKASIHDLRQMYSYARLWNAHKVILLYPGVSDKNQFHPFHTQDDNTHYCKLCYVSVLDKNNLLDSTIATQILHQLEFS